MSFTYCLDFNLRFAGEEAEEFLAYAVRTWPPLWEVMPGVTSTLLLSNAFALGGERGYRWRVDLEKASDLLDVDRALKSDDGETRRIVARWFDARSSALATLSETVASEVNYNAGEAGEEGLIHLVFSHADYDQSQKHVEVAAQTEGVLSVQSHRELLSPFAGSYATWFRVGGLEHLDSIFEATGDLASRTAQLFGEVREIDGSLFVGA